MQIVIFTLLNLYYMKATIVKNIMVGMVFCLLCCPAYSQIFFEPGINYSGLTEDPLTNHMQPGIGRVIRAGIIYGINEKLSTEASFGHSVVNLNQELDYGQIRTRLSYFELPLALRYHVAGPVNLSAGISVAFPSNFSVRDHAYPEKLDPFTLFYMAGIHVRPDERIELTLKGIFGTEKLVSYQEIGPYGELSEPRDILKLKGIQLSIRINLIFLEG